MKPTRTKDAALTIVALIATLPEREVLLHRAVTSVCAQKLFPSNLVIVVDSDTSTSSFIPNLPTSEIPIHIIENKISSGAASSWNKGIRFIQEHWPDCYIAILDDDDTWDCNHISLCSAHAYEHDWPDVVLSGLRLIIDGHEQNREPICRVCVDDFLIGNPGWQGSNTFIRLSALVSSGCFTDNLASCNDRDLAIRVLNLKNVKVAFTESHTSNWILDTKQRSLSTKLSESKLDGLGHFYHLHKHLMTDDVKLKFFLRAYSLFGWCKKDIQQRAKEWKHAYTSPTDN
ncbi:glycosyltransferase family A protein [uncultured Amphritea sp.]|uniref:glycosyltransferase family A protein n=1 Tax=uncultured Amphritea sp. TaxID=981605 RepID=UPI002602A37F|nr:glycosyltransferase family A protein [uncultured Amphritea sp.]